VQRWEFNTEDEAREMVRKLVAARTGGTWREQGSEAATAPPPAR
jgi:hypothetical protein